MNLQPLVREYIMDKFPKEKYAFAAHENTISILNVVEEYLQFRESKLSSKDIEPRLGSESFEEYCIRTKTKLSGAQGVDGSKYWIDGKHYVHKRTSEEPGPALI